LKEPRNTINEFQISKIFSWKSCQCEKPNPKDVKWNWTQHECGWEIEPKCSLHQKELRHEITARINLKDISSFALRCSTLKSTTNRVILRFVNHMLIFWERKRESKTDKTVRKKKRRREPWANFAVNTAVDVMETSRPFSSWIRSVCVDFRPWRKARYLTHQLINKCTFVLIERIFFSPFHSFLCFKQCFTQQRCLQKGYIVERLYWWNFENKPTVL
jgi:hypothetical protein